MNGWARDLPLVTVPRSDLATPVTFIYPFYENHAFLATQADVWRAYPDDLSAHLAIIVVDDGSPDPARVPAGLPSLRLFRIHEDRRWNWLAARNIGAHHAADGWLLLTDMDHVVPADTLRAVVYGQHDVTVIYAFARREHTGGAIPPHSASFLMTRRLFWTIGGYDETFSGRYGTDGLFRRRAAKHAPFQVLSDVLVRHEKQGDSSTTTYGRKEQFDAELSKIVASLPVNHKPVVLSFPYHEVTCV